MRLATIFVVVSSLLGVSVSGCVKIPSPIDLGKSKSESDSDSLKNSGEWIFTINAQEKRFKYDEAFAIKGVEEETKEVLLIYFHGASVLGSWGLITVEDVDRASKGEPVNVHLAIWLGMMDVYASDERDLTKATFSKFGLKAGDKISGKVEGKLLGVFGSGNIEDISFKDVKVVLSVAPWAVGLGI